MEQVNLNESVATISIDRYQNLLAMENELIDLKSSKTQESILETTIEQILGEREQTHGSFQEQAGISDMLKFTMMDAKNWNYLGCVRREALCMIVHKISRILSGDSSYKDHWNDIAGYATLVSKELE